jgi:hypothetical protein
VRSFDFKTAPIGVEMKLICANCLKIKDEEEFDMWFPAIRVRKRECKECERRFRIKWWLKELEKQKQREAGKKQ